MIKIISGNLRLRHLCHWLQTLLDMHLIYNILFIILKTSITFNGDSLSVRWIFLNVRKLVNSLPSFWIVLFELIFIWIIWVNVNLLMICLSGRCRSASNHHPVIFRANKGRRIILLNEWLILLCYEAWRGRRIKIVLLLV
jgi:hypothetical protein